MGDFSWWTRKRIFLPSITSILGIRDKEEGLEIGLGPNLSIAGIGLVFAVGRNFKLGKVNVPINLSWVPSTMNANDEQRGHRVSLTFGFTMSSDK